MNQFLSGAGRTRAIALVLGALALGLVGVFLLFRHPTSPGGGPLPGPISDACWEQLEAQQQLGLLAVRSLETYGLLGPGLFDLSSDPTQVRVSPGAEPTVPGDEPRQRFAAALQAVNAKPALVQRLRDGHAQALQACGERCPAKPYAIEVELVKEARNPDAGFYKWRVKGEIPTNAEWQQGFLNLYGGAPKLSCTAYTVLDVSTGYEGQTAANTATTVDGRVLEQEKFANEPARKAEAKKKERDDESDPSGRDFTEGSAATGSGCNSNSHTSCQQCWITQTISGGYYWNGARWCCGSCS